MRSFERLGRSPSHARNCPGSVGYRSRACKSSGAFPETKTGAAHRSSPATNSLNRVCLEDRPGASISFTGHDAQPKTGTTPAPPKATVNDDHPPQQGVLEGYKPVTVDQDGGYSASASVRFRAAKVRALSAKPASPVGSGSAVPADAEAYVQPVPRSSSERCFMS